MRFGRTDNLAGHVEELELQLSQCQEDNLKLHELEDHHLRQLVQIRDVCERKARHGGDGRVSITTIITILDQPIPLIGDDRDH